MGLTLPPELADLLNRAGGKWPQADEDALHRLAGSWRSLGTQFRTTADRTEQTSRDVAGQHHGQSVDAFLTQSGEVQRHLHMGATAAEQTGLATDAMAKATLQTKSVMFGGLQKTHAQVEKAKSNKAAAAFLGPIIGILLRLLGKFLWRIFTFLIKWIWRAIVWLLKAIWWLIKKVIDFFRRLFGGGNKKPPVKKTPRDELLDELTKNGVKHNPDDVVRIARDPSGRIVFLEKGNARAGLEHIVGRHGDDFVRAGIPKDQIPDVVMQAATSGRQVGMQGTRPIYEIMHNGVLRRIAVTVGSNGFIVGANPA